jgi:transcriptional regulator with XRE-family HTH domain
MLRYKRLLQKALDPDAADPLTLRDLARRIGIPVPSLHNYVQFDTLPRIKNVGKMAAYFGEPISSLFSEDDDTTAALVAAVRRLPEKRKKQLLKEL